nr:class I poly(R)-hydroxyalkanoic acid synthase [Zoogloea sp.]
MSVTPEQSAEALQGMFKFGQSMAEGFFDFLGKQGVAFPQAAPTPIPQIPMPESQELAKLQQELAEAHARLWASMAQLKPGESAEPLIKPQPGDRRFNA